MKSKTIASKIVIAAACFVFLNNPVIAQQFPVDTIRQGASDNRINIVFMGDGYLSSQMTDFTTDAQNINNQLFLTTPFKQYAPYFNVYTIKVVSQAAGAKHPGITSECGAQPIADPLNFFGSRFDAFGIHRLVVADSLAKAQSVLATHFPEYDVPVLIVNSTYYGGSGGWLITSTKNISSPEIGIHELAHSFANLADEYWAGPQYASEKPNMTKQSNPQLVKWKNWVGTENVGVFPFAVDPTWYRPVTSMCKMELLGMSFCAVCREAIVERIHELAKPIDRYLPSSSSLTVTSGNQGFKLDLVPPEPNTLKVSWKLDGITVASNVDTINLTATQLAGASHVVSAVVTDTTAFTRDQNHITLHSYMVQWNINTSTGLTSPELYAARIKIYPNPFVDQLYVDYRLDKKADVRIDLLNLSGALVETIENKNQPRGNYQVSFSATGKKLPTGVYFVRFSLNGQSMTEEKIRIN
jgi:hypothetical protein